MTQEIWPSGCCGDTPELVRIDGRFTYRCREHHQVAQSGDTPEEAAEKWNFVSQGVLMPEEEPKDEGEDDFE